MPTWEENELPSGYDETERDVERENDVEPEQHADVPSEAESHDAGGGDMQRPPHTEPAPPPSQQQQQQKQQPKRFDPLNDFLGIHTEGIHAGHAGDRGQGGQPAAAQSMILHGGHDNHAFGHPASLEQTAAQRVANVKNIMRQGNPGPQQAPMNGFGVDGANMQVALYGQQPYGAQYPHQQMYANAAMQQQQQMYNTMAMQQQMVLYQSMNPQQHLMSTYNPQQLAMMQQQQLAYQQQMMGPHQRQFGAGRMGMAPGMRPGSGTVGAGVPAMAAERVEVPVANYKVQRGTKPTRVNAGDQAFGPILDDLKAKLKK